jgi:hypothetical protein
MFEIRPGVSVMIGSQILAKLVATFRQANARKRESS